MTIRTGSRLRLTRKNGEPEQFGIALGSAWNRSVVVRLDPEYRTDRFDDGLRDVPVDQIQEVTQ